MAFSCFDLCDWCFGGMGDHSPWCVQGRQSSHRRTPRWRPASGRYRRRMFRRRQPKGSRQMELTPTEQAARWQPTSGGPSVPPRFAQRARGARVSVRL